MNAATAKTAPAIKPKSAQRKPRANSALKGLAPDLQQELFDYMEGAGDQKGHTYRQCIAWLAEQQVEVGYSQLSKWRDWYYIRLNLQWCKELTALLIEDDRAAGAEYSDEDIERKGNRMFNLLAIKTCNDKAWSRHQTLSVRRRAVAVVERKLEFEMEKYENQRAKEKKIESEPKMTPEEKEARMRHIMGTE